ncbi:hypothetical protein P3G55_00870 [Leptospira sp. 96542]|nr:hypothetical protein [Leptospira sp. 96542]
MDYMTEKSYWRNSEPYHLVEVFIESDRVVFKDWFDTGKDPNRYDWTFEEIKGELAKSTIEYHLGARVYHEVLQTVLTKM